MARVIDHGEESVARPGDVGRAGRASGDTRTTPELQATEAGLDPAEAIAARKAIEDTIGLEEHYAVEEQTVERGSGG